MSDKQINWGGPAFPQPLIDNQGRIDSSDSYGFGGLTLRDYFAAASLTGIQANSANHPTLITKDVKLAYKTADLMIAERTKIPKP